MNLKKSLVIVALLFIFLSSHMVGMKQDISKDVVNVGIFLENSLGKKIGDDILIKEGTELISFLKKREFGTRELGAVSLVLIKTLIQKVDVVIASSSLAYIIGNIFNEKEEDIDYEIKRHEEGIFDFTKMEKRYQQQGKNKIEILKIEIKIKEYKSKIKECKMLKRLLASIKDENFSVYKTKDKKFVVFVNKNNKKFSLSNYDLDARNLTKIKKDALVKEFEGVYGYVKVDSLEKIFQIKKINRPKIIYLMGHGDFKEESVIAQLRPKQYACLVGNFLPKINCNFLFVNSCFAAGLNIEKAFKAVARESKKVYEEVDIKFPIALGVVSDVEVNFLKRLLYEKFSFNKFFEGICTLLFSTEEDRLLRESKLGLENIVGCIAEPILQNTTLVRFPGVRKFFRPVNVDDKITIITYPYLIAHELKEFREDEKIKLKEKKKRPSRIKISRLPINIVNKEAILLYPTLVMLPIEIYGEKPPVLVSMFPGDAYHFIKKLVAKNIPLSLLIKDMFGKLHIRSNKLFLIGDLTCKNYNKSGILYPKNLSKDNENQKLELKNCYAKTSFREVLVKIELPNKKIIRREMGKLTVNFWFTINGKHKKIECDNLYRKIKVIHNISPEDCKNTLIQELNKIEPSEEGYVEATGGIENEITLENALNIHFDLLKGKLPLVLKAKMNYLKKRIEKLKKQKGKRLHQLLLKDKIGNLKERIVDVEIRSKEKEIRKIKKELKE
ncbi:hypothetical protein ACFLYU_01760 [Candidatus Dependentiae bacterium]